ncbi:glutaminase A [Ornithinimicrobium pratense]|uniref:Glutaminase n=1 Tax=Ornithinimicrobium pratense TaxID=2593973 RepID=A0A5J6V428_9MICO|nr:glutaminase A [Ornithinimicrobium pratense]QFG68659.1 glutaminase A [Ornithinimicrobium pratense]
MFARDLPAYLDDLLDRVRDDDDGEPDELPVHAEADLDRLAVAVVGVDGQVCTAGDAEFYYPIQSLSKAVVYGLAIDCVGMEEVLRHIDVEPSGDAFNRISLEGGQNRPANPMINAGALTAHSLVDGHDAEHRFARIRELLSAMAGRELEMDEDSYRQEMDDAHRNLGIAHMVKALSELPDDPHDVVDGYSRQCALRVSTVELARIAATLANDGVVPGTEERVLSRQATRHVLSVMLTCGMYDSAGDWVSSVGIPAKSGVSGGIVGAVPGRGGIATYSPRLDKHGNSTRGQVAFEHLAVDLDLHVLRPRHRDE